MSESDENNGLNTLKKVLKRYGHIYALVIISFFALFTRLQGADRLRTENGEIALLGNDAWYHLRATSYSVENYPFPIGFDAKTGYPEGSLIGTFGTLYDFVHSTIALVIGLGDPSPELIRQVLAYSSPVLTVFVLISAYFLMKYMTDNRWAGVLSAFLLALIPGTFYSRSVVGFAQHHVAEVLLMLLSILALMKALDYAEKNYITLEVILNKEYGELKPWLAYVGVALGAIFAYYLTWPPSMMVFGLIGMTAVIYAIFGYITNRPTEPGILTLATVLVGTLLMVLVRTPIMEASVSNPSLLHVTVVVSALIGTVAVFGITKYATQRNWPNSKYLGTIVGIGVVSTIVIAVLQPGLFDEVLSHIIRLLGNPFGLGSETVQTIEEEQTTTLLQLSFSQYGFLLLTSIFGMFLYVFYGLKEKNCLSSRFLLVVIASFILVISLRTIRFNYYLAPFVAIFATYAIYRLVKFVELPDSYESIEGYHIILALLLVFLIVPVLIIPVEGHVVYQDNAVDIQDYQQWEEPLDWMSENTPHDGIETYGSYSEPFEYPDESYGVMSWWDYGHWITVTGDRTPVANPFQQNSRTASQFLLADNPEDANQAVQDVNEHDAQVNYVAIDWQMVSPYAKYPAIVEHNNEYELDDTIQPYYSTSPGGGASIEFFTRDQSYYEMMMNRLYFGHGSEMEASSYTVDYETQGAGGQQQGNVVEETTLRTVTPELNPITRHQSAEEAQQYAGNQTEVNLGGIGGLQPPERVDALENYRLVTSSPHDSLRTSAGIEYNAYDQMTENQITINELETNPSSVKIFEKVEGADVEGTVVNETDTVQIVVTMQDPNTQQTFDYQQTVDVEGDTFTTTVPYSTSDYDENPYAPEVQSTSSYRVIDEDGNEIGQFEVSEQQVIGEDDDVVEFSE